MTRAAASSADQTYLFQQQERARVAAQDPAAYGPVWPDEPDEWNAKARAVIDYRDRIADSVPGPVPEIGTPEWAAANWREQAAAYARHERDVAAAQGPAISARMAATAGAPQPGKDVAEAAETPMREWDNGRGWANSHVPHDEIERRRAEIPQQRRAEPDAELEAAFHAARAACAAASAREPRDDADDEATDDEPAGDSAADVEVATG